MGAGWYFPTYFTGRPGYHSRVADASRTLKKSVTFTRCLPIGGINCGIVDSQESRKSGGHRPGSELSAGDFGFVPRWVTGDTDVQRLLSLTRQQADHRKTADLARGAEPGEDPAEFEHARRCVLRGQQVLFLCFNAISASA